MLKMKTSCGNKLIINFRSEKPIPKPFWPSVVKCLMFFTDDCAKNYSIQYSFLCTYMLSLPSTHGLAGRLCDEFSFHDDLLIGPRGTLCPKLDGHSEALSRAGLEGDEVGRLGSVGRPGSGSVRRSLLGQLGGKLLGDRERASGQLTHGNATGTWN